MCSWRGRKSLKEFKKNAEEFLFFSKNNFSQKKTQIHNDTYQTLVLGILTAVLRTNKINSSIPGYGCCRGDDRAEGKPSWEVMRTGAAFSIPPPPPTPPNLKGWTFTYKETLSRCMTSSESWQVDSCTVGVATKLVWVIIIPELSGLGLILLVFALTRRPCLILPLNFNCTVSTLI